MRKLALENILNFNGYITKFDQISTIVYDSHGRKVAVIDEMVANSIQFFQMPNNVVLDSLILYAKTRPFER